MTASAHVLVSTTATASGQARALGRRVWTQLGEIDAALVAAASTGQRIAWVQACRTCAFYVARYRWAEQALRSELMNVKPPGMSQRDADDRWRDALDGFRR